MTAQNIIRHSLNEAAEATTTFCCDPITIVKLAAAAGLMAESLKAGGKILSCGNGGSACDAMHFAEELTGRFRENRRALAAIAISDPAHLTCVANDFGYENVFARYVEALGQSGGVLLAISTSGGSRNVLLAAKAAKAANMHIVVLTGHKETELTKMADVVIHTPESVFSDRVQELHIKCIHIMIEAIEHLMFDAVRRIN